MPIVRLPGGALRDEIREPLYDTLDLTAGAIAQTTRTFFASVKDSLVLSNLRQAKQLETAVSFRCQGLAFDVHNFYTAMEQTVPLVLESSALRFTVGEKIYWEGPARFAAGRIYSDVAGKTDAVFSQHGDKAIASVILSGKHVVDINPLQRFQVDWLMDAFANAAEIAIATVPANEKLRYVCSLKGLKRRPVQ